MQNKDIIALGESSKNKLHLLDKLMRSNEWKQIITDEYSTKYLQSLVLLLANGKAVQDDIKAIGLLQVFLDKLRNELEVNITNGEIMKQEGEQDE